MIQSFCNAGFGSDDENDLRRVRGARGDSDEDEVEMSVWDIDSAGPLSCGSHVKEEVDDARSRIRARISIRPAENERTRAREKNGEREWEWERQNAVSRARESREKEKDPGTLVVSCPLGSVLYVIIINKADLPVFLDQSFTSTPQRYQRFVPD